MAVLVSVVMPEAWWVMVAGVTGGVVLGTILVVVRRGRRSSGPSGDDPHVLFRSADDRPGATERAEVPADRELRTAHGYHSAR